MTNTDAEEEQEIKKKIYEDPVKKSFNSYSSSYDTWIFENYTKERLKSLGIIH